MPYTKQNNQQQLQKGEYSITQRKESIHIDTMNAHNMGSGFGCAVMREAMTIALKSERRVTLTATKSSHLFHLYMGMLPKERQINYVENTYGFRGARLIDRLIQYQTLTKPEQLFIVGMMQQEKLSEAGTLIDLQNHRDALIQLRSKTISYCTFEFIAILLELLKNNPNNKYPDTRDLNSVEMELSPEGKLRWQQAINEETEFRPFKGLEQLVPFLTEEQHQTLKSILAAKQKAEKLWKTETQCRAALFFQEKDTHTSNLTSDSGYRIV